ncbi:MAG: iron-sulfur cluster repair di-iron protein [Mangrovibacterium sp.]
MQITGNSIVGEIVRANFQAAQIFENSNIDFCCGGNISINEACERSGADATVLLSELESVLQHEDYDSKYFESLPLDLLSNYIVERHHKYVSEKSPFIQLKLRKLCDVHGANHPELFEVKQLFDEAVGNLAQHMKKEELILFPYIGRMVNFRNNGTGAPAEFGHVLQPINVMMNEHQAEGDRFMRISKITAQYQTPADGCNTYEVTYRSIEEFEKDLHLHIHLENNILFPKAIELEKELIDN